MDDRDWQMISFGEWHPKWMTETAKWLASANGILNGWLEWATANGIQNGWPRLINN